MGGFGFYQLHKLDKEIVGARNLAAKQEVESAMHSLREQVQRQSTLLANWDETRQQLVNPDYYSYWKSSRVQHAGLLSELFLGVDLYGADGRPLPGSEAEKKLMTQPESNQGTTLYFPNMSRIVHVVPVYSDSTNQTLLNRPGF